MSCHGAEGEDEMIMRIKNPKKVEGSNKDRKLWEKSGEEEGGCERRRVAYTVKSTERKTERRRARGQPLLPGRRSSLTGLRFTADSDGPRNETLPNIPITPALLVPL